MLRKLALITLMGMSASAMASDWQVKLGGSLVDPTGSTNTALGKVEADYQFAFTPSVEYFFTDSISTELLLANPLKHDIKLDGAKIGSIKQLPPTLTVKYTFNNSTPFTPYVGVGATGFFAWDAKGPVVEKVKNDVGVAGQIGVNFKPADAKNWGVFLDVRYADLDPKVRLTDAYDNAEFKLKIDPVVYTLGYSYRF
jgi:outer membrane protein